MSSQTAIASDEYGQTEDGQKVTRYTLSNSKGTVVKIIDYGAIITEIIVPDKNGKPGDINLGYDNIKDYEVNPPYIGAVIGRVVNRIAGAQFTLDGQTYKLFANDGENTLHGGKVGFSKKLWTSSVKDNKLLLQYVSADGEEGYPGELTATVTYSLDEANALALEYTATTTKPTPVNLTNHAYFNLAGHDYGNIDDQVITLHAEKFTPLDENFIPTGEIKSVEGTVFDLRKPVRFGDRLYNVPHGKGLTENYCLDNDGAFVLAARVEHPPTGRYMECHTTEPGLQLYTSYFLQDQAGKGGVKYKRYGAFCLEAQHYADSVHQPNFPSTILRPGETYKQKTVYTFGLL